MHRFLFILLLISFRSLAFAQVETAAERIENSSFGGSGSQSMIGKKLPPAGVEGSPYLNDFWSDASIFLTDNQSYKNIKAKLDLYQSSLLVDLEGREVLIGLFQLDEFSLDKAKFKVIDGACYEVLANNLGFDVAVLRKHFMKLQKPTFNAALNTGNRNYEYLAKSKDVLFIGSGELINLPMSKKKSKNLLKDRIPDLSAFVESEKLIPKNSTDFVNLLESLLTDH